MYYDKYKHIRPEILGKVIYNETISETSGSFEEIGYDILDVLCDCKTEDQFDLVNRTIMAIAGSKMEVLEKLAMQLQDCEEIQKICKEHGFLATISECEYLWELISENKYKACWISIENIDVWDEISSYLEDNILDLSLEQ